MAEPRYCEVRRLVGPRVPVAVAALVGVSLGWSLRPADPAVLIAGGLFVLVVALGSIRRGTVVVEADRLVVASAPLGLRRRAVPLAAIEAVDVETGAAGPARGIRDSALPWRPGERWAATLGASGTVRVRRADGSEVVVGSSRPDELAAAVRAAADR